MGFEIKTILSSPKDGEKLPNPYMRPIETIKKKEEEQKRKDEEDVRAIEKQLGIGTNYHEGLNRELRTIYISNTLKDHAPNLVQELQEIWQKVGFSIHILDDGDRMWVEDATIRLHNGKIYIPFASDTGFFKPGGNREHISNTGLWNGPQSFHPSVTETPDTKIVHWKSYLEGGNVLTCQLANGQPWAIIGEESLRNTIRVLGLEDINASSDEDYQRQEENIRQQHSKNIEIAKQQIAQDLELPLENIIYIPQFDFHIDMWFRPLQDGVIATPDFDSAIHILTDLLATEQFTPEEKTELETLKQGLETMNTTTAPFIWDAKWILEESGFKTVNVPCFSVLPSAYGKWGWNKGWAGNKGSFLDNERKLRKVPLINYMNGIAGTSISKTTYYITNTSGITSLDSAIAKHFNWLGIDEVFFVSSNYLLGLQGWLDCVTLESLLKSLLSLTDWF